MLHGFRGTGNSASRARATHDKTLTLEQGDDSNHMKMNRRRVQRACSAECAAFKHTPLLSERPPRTSISRLTRLKVVSSSTFNCSTRSDVPPGMLLIRKAWSSSTLFL